MESITKQKLLAHIDRKIESLTVPSAGCDVPDSYTKLFEHPLIPVLRAVRDRFSAAKGETTEEMRQLAQGVEVVERNKAWWGTAGLVLFGGIALGSLGALLARLEPVGLLAFLTLGTELAAGACLIYGGVHKQMAEREVAVVRDLNEWEPVLASAGTCPSPVSSISSEAPVLFSVPVLEKVSI